MPFGAHETMEVHEILSEKKCMIEHFSMYERQCQDPTLREMLHRHIQTATQSYNQLVSYTHDYHTAQTKMMPMHTAHTYDIKYGLHNPAPSAPQTDMTKMNDQSIASAMLLAHKNSAKNHMAAALECADPNVRQMLVNGSVMCTHEAYETFNYMNHRGMYQVPTMSDHTAKTMLHHYQPMAQGMTGSMEATGQAAYGTGQNGIQDAPKM
ncbi:spore coat protein [Effusibacillus lacus]|uniref:Coat protein F n=1 Tax=Effusibacillus lacus TaxID=1348429 RepID=A0A292YMR1_9BACL|nr:spore coat protein [Effusibacillus lacus]TCS76887.1 spore coat protein CotF [Effusibacillus lacus]GAX91218.1 coat protein F [Effusibacillus lacus]